MTWQWVVLILGVLAVLIAQGYVNVLKARVVLGASLGRPDAPEHHGVNGSNS